MWEEKLLKAIQIIEKHIAHLGVEDVKGSDKLCWIYSNDERNLISEVYEHYVIAFETELRYMVMPTGIDEVFSKADLYQILNILDMIYFCISL